MATSNGSSPFHAGVATNLVTTVELSIACRNLLDRDLLSKSDPLCVVLLKDFGSSQFKEVGRTEVIKNTLNPDFVKKITVDYHFEESQKLIFDVYDSDSSSTSLDKHDFLGRMECTLGEIVSVQGSQFRRTLRTNVRSDAGTITVVAEELGKSRELYVMQFCAEKLDKKDFFGKSDPFLVFSKQIDDGSMSVTHKTEVIKRNLNPTWKPFSIHSRVLCSANPEKLIKIAVYDYDRDGSHDFIGEFETNLITLLKGRGQDNIYPCINAKKKAKKRNYKHSGIVRLMSIKVETEYSFLDYITGGTQMHFTVAIDFTASNGDPNKPGTLHYLHPTIPNQYSIAIRAVGEIIQDYDSDKMFPALGFGAKIPPNGVVSHEFFLNGNPTDPYCSGVEGILQAYYDCLQRVQLYGPTNFEPVITHVARFAAANTTGSAYFVLLIITDGVITDMQNTKRAIAAATQLPMSIIIVGVGEADFEAMEELDGDVVPGNQKVTAAIGIRDIVQFVPMRNFLRNSDWHMNQAGLAKEVLAEIPGQVSAFMKMKNIAPIVVSS